MRRRVGISVAAIFALAVLLLFQGAQAQSMPPNHRQRLAGLEDLPDDDRSLARLERNHMKMLQYVAKQCEPATAAKVAPASRNPAHAKQDICKKLALDKLVARERDPTMTAYHGAISASRRYDTARASQYWRNVKRSKQLGRAPR